MLGGFQRDIYRASQGYSIELNDMHGKPKSIKYFGQKKNGDILPDVVSSTEYFYDDRPEDYNEGVNRFSKRTLNNQVDLVLNYEDILNGDATKPDIRTGELGVSRQVFGDLRKVSYKSITTGGAVQGHAFLVPPFFVAAFPTGSLRASAHESDVETGVINKVIHRKGIVKKVVTFDGQSKSEAENLAFDPYTGKALLQRVNNIYDEDQYSYEIPAYQAYKRMGPSYQNQQQTLQLNTDKSSLQALENNCTGYMGINTTTWPGMSQHFAQGDEYIVQLNKTTNSTAGNLSRWTYMFTINNTHYFHILESGQFFNSLPDPNSFALRFNLVRSGYRNQLNTPAMLMTSLQSPATTSTIPSIPWSLETCDGTLSGNMDLVVKNDVLDATAYTYDEAWHYMNNCLDSASCMPFELNDFLRGNLGIFRLTDNAKFNSTRTVSGISKRGTLEEFHQFNWNEPRIFDVTNESKWIRTEGVTQYYLMGHPKEKIDRLDNRQSIRLTNYQPDNPGIASGQMQNCGYLEGGISTFESDEGGEFSLNFGHVIEKINKTASFGYFGAHPVWDNSSGELYIDKPTSTLYNANYVVKTLIADQTILFPVASSANNLDVCGQFAKIDYDNSSCIYSDFISGTNHTIQRIILDDGARTDLTNRGDGLLWTEGQHHSGKYSYSFPQSNQTISLESFQPNPNATYHLSAWAKSFVKINGLQEVIYDLNSINLIVDVIGVNNAGMEVTIGQLELTDEKTNLSGSAEDIYQKMEANLVFSVAPLRLEIQYDQPAMGTIEFVLFDDLCVMPLSGSINTSVMDDQLLRPAQSIDQNSYLSLYGYDEDGELVKISKETEEGTFTIQEQQKYIIDGQ